MESGSDGEYEHNEHFYQNDLLLAAELGKTLLERNKDLENQLFQAQQINHEQNLENEFLIKQLEALRQVNESRMKVYEELDRNSGELELRNRRMISESKTDKERIHGLCKTVETLEQRCAELQERVDEYKERERDKLRKERRKTLSVPSLLEVEDLKNYYNTDRMSTEQLKNWRNPFETQIKQLQDVIKNLRTQKLIEKKKRNEIEEEMSILLTENQDTRNKLDLLTEKAEKLQTLERELLDNEIHRNKICRACRAKLDTDSETAFVNECETDSVHVKSGYQLVRLRNGGSAFGSMDTISKVADENRDNVRGQVPTMTGISLLSELDAQYHILVEKYECLLRAKSKKIAYAGTNPETPDVTPLTTPAATPITEGFKAFPDCSNRVSRGIQVGTPAKARTFDLDTDTDPTSGHFDRSPEYKRLFKEIFETLKRSMVTEEVASQP